MHGSSLLAQLKSLAPFYTPIYRNGSSRAHEERSRAKTQRRKERTAPLGDLAALREIFLCGSEVNPTSAVRPCLLRGWFFGFGFRFFGLRRFLARQQDVPDLNLCIR